MKYAYLDKGNILHISKSEETAKKFSKTGKVVETEYPASHGYPLADDKEIIVYSPTEMKWEAKGEAIEEAETKYPALAALYRECNK